MPEGGGAPATPPPPPGGAPSRSGRRRCAIVGAGRMGMVHGHLLQVYPGTDVVGFADPQKGTHDRLSSQGLNAPVFASVGELLSAVAPDAVFVCTPTHTHLAVTREVLAARATHLFM